ncbi:MAG: DNA alkylation repair protein [Propionibacteriaceae bacterium]|jgi:3-methyladenine DNA glycosylase AlkD|nr:DNA alkylation repair protein [Propionibacteriaceae bacterium]
MTQDPITDILARIRAELIANIDPIAKQAGQRYFKEEILTYGMKVPVATAIAKRYRAEMKAAGLDKAAIWALCDQLWASGYMEEAFVACVFAESQVRRYEASDFPVFERWVHNHVSNWATCDTLCNHTVGDLVMAFPELGERLLGWAQSTNRWVKRAAAVTLIVPARKGLFHDLGFQIADSLLTDSEDLVQKGYGWLLKAIAESDQAAVFAYVMDHKAVMPRTALRYAIEKMPADLKAQAMAR